MPFPLWRQRIPLANTRIPHNDNAIPINSKAIPDIDTPTVLIMDGPDAYCAPGVAAIAAAQA